MMQGLSISLFFLLLLVATVVAFTSVPFQPRRPLRRIIQDESTATNSRLWAKKKGNKKKNKKKNQQANSGFAWASSFTLKPYEAQALRELASTALSSFEGRTGKPLAPDVSVGSNDPPKALWNAPVACVIVAPRDAAAVPSMGANLQYANLAALEMVGLKADDFERFCPASSTITQSNPTEEGGEGDSPPDVVVTKLDLPMEMKGEKKYESGYKKKVIRGQRRGEDEDDNADDITILNANRWVLEKNALVDGKFVTTTMGVAYAWEEWQVGDSLVCSPGAKQRIMVNVDELEAELEKQAKHIRQLKEEQGLGNKDPQVMEAVEKLLKLKDQIVTATAT